MRNTVFERRALAAWRARACAAAVATGSMIFCVGSGIAVPISLNAAPLSSLPALGLCALIAWRAQSVLKRPVEKTSALARVAWVALALTLLLGAVFLIAAQVSLAERTLLTRSHVNWISTITLAAVTLCALCGCAAADRFCFAVRWALPVLLVVLGAKALQRGTPIGLFPVLGAGVLPLAWSSLCMLCAASPALLLLCPIGEDDGGPEFVPPARFFVCRVLLGGGVGVMMLLSLTMCNTYDTLISLTIWGERMMVTCTHEPRMGVLQMLLILTQMLALGLSGVALLCGAERAASQAARRKHGEDHRQKSWGREWQGVRTTRHEGADRKRRISGSFVACFALATALLFSMEQIGYSHSLYAAPVLTAPALIALAMSGTLRGKGKKGDVQ